MATIWDVAARAGVSKSTVSLVLNKSPLVKDETRERVEQAIRELNYVPNNNARGLVKRESKCFGVIIPRSDLHSAQNIYDFGYHTSLYAFNVMNGISSGLMNSDYGLLIEHFFDDGSGELPSLVRNNRVDGVFLIGNLMQSQMVDEIVKRGIPVVVIGHHYPQVDCVTTDVPQGIYLGVRHLLEKGYRNICYLNSPVRYGSSLSRLDGLRGAFEEFGLCVTEENHIYCQHNTGEGGYLAAKLLWERDMCPDALATANEQIALGVMRFLYEKGIRIPDDISIVTYEASVLGGYASPALTTVNVEKERMGKIATEMMLRRLSDPDWELQYERLQPKLVLRESVGEVQR